MKLTFNNLYETWKTADQPSKNTLRMTRSTLKHLAASKNEPDWQNMDLMPLANAIALLDARMQKLELSSQSKSNYRGYLRRLYTFAQDNGYDLHASNTQMFWPAVINGSIPRRQELAYQKLVRWAIGSSIFPKTVVSSDLYDWACSEKDHGNKHWRQDYKRLQQAWSHLSRLGDLNLLDFQTLPKAKNCKYALPFEKWPVNLRQEWLLTCQKASAPLRNGGVRPWRSVTQKQYQTKVEQFLGWMKSCYPDVPLEKSTLADTLSPENCQTYLNWLVGRSDSSHLNPSHTAFLRAVRGFHRFLFESDEKVIEGFDNLTRRCEVEERDKSSKLIAYDLLKSKYDEKLAATLKKMKKSANADTQKKSLANDQVETIILGILITRALRSSNIRGIKWSENLTKFDGRYHLHFSPDEMKGHRKFDTDLPAELTAIVDDYIVNGYKALRGRRIDEGDLMLLNTRGKPFETSSFATRVKNLSKKVFGHPINAHLFRHILATHAAQQLKMTPTELAAFLAHRSPMTVMKYYEVTNPKLAAARFDRLRNGD